MARPKFSFCFLVIFVGSYGITCYLGDICHPKEHAALFVFGNSLFDVGNNNYINTTANNQESYSPYGETFFNYPSGRFSDGRVIPDFIVKYAKLPLIPTYIFPSYQRYLYGVNFASARAGALIETHQGLVMDMKTQLIYFKKVSKILRQELGDAETTTLLAKEIYLINIGSNDYLVSLTDNSSVFAAEKYVDMVVGNLTTVIKGIHKTGGRKFGVLNQSALGCIPLVKALVNGSKGSCVEEASALTKLHNRLKEGNMACCRSSPYRRYYSCRGKKTVKDYELCENPSDYVFFDSIHPTERLDQIISEFMCSGNQSIAGPYNLKTLFEE